MAENGFDIQELVSALTSNPDLIGKLQGLVSGDGASEASGLVDLAKGVGINVDADQVSQLLQGFGGLQGLLDQLPSGEGSPIDAIKDALGGILGK